MFRSAKTKYFVLYPLRDDNSASISVGMTYNYFPADKFQRFAAR